MFIEYNRKSDHINTQLFKNIDCSIPMPSKSALKLKSKVIDRENALSNNPLSKNWVHLPEVTETQASYLIAKVMVSLWDRIYPTLSEETRDYIFPLQSSRSLLEDNVTKHGLEFTHAGINPRVLTPSLILSKPKLLEEPQGLVKNLLEDFPNILLAPRQF
jgi:hypothetical protein